MMRLEGSFLENTDSFIQVFKQLDPTKTYKFKANDDRWKVVWFNPSDTIKIQSSDEYFKSSSLEKIAITIQNSTISEVEPQAGLKLTPMAILRHANQFPELYRLALDLIFASRNGGLQVREVWEPSNYS